MIQEFILQYRVFTKSIISHLFLKHFHRNSSTYKIITPSYGVKEEICRRMPRNFFSSTQFQRKRKSLVFCQSINFLWSSLKREARKVFRKIRPPPILQEPFRVLECLLFFTCQLYNNLDNCFKNSIPPQLIRRYGHCSAFGH